MGAGGVIIIGREGRQIDYLCPSFAAAAENSWQLVANGLSCQAAT